MVFGANSEIVAMSRGVTVQALGGTGGLKLGADFLRKFAPGAQVWISDPSWENHRALFEGAGFVVNTYPYYAPATHGLDFDGMRGALEKLPAGCDRRAACVLPQPDGRRPSAEQWTTIIDIVRSRGIIPFLDIAYQGFADGIDADGGAVRPLRRDARPTVRLDFVLEIILALWRTHRRAVRRDDRQRRGGARAITS